VRIPCIKKEEEEEQEEEEEEEEEEVVVVVVVVVVTMTRCSYIQGCALGGGGGTAAWQPPQNPLKLKFKKYRLRRYYIKSFM
jgi:hypothetical protein